MFTEEEEKEEEVVSFNLLWRLIGVYYKESENETL